MENSADDKTEFRTEVRLVDYFSKFCTAICSYIINCTVFLIVPVSAQVALPGLEAKLLQMVAQGQTRLVFWLSQQKLTCPGIKATCLIMLQ